MLDIICSSKSQSSCHFHIFLGGISLDEMYKKNWKMLISKQLLQIDVSFVNLPLFSRFQGLILTSLLIQNSVRS